MTTAAESAAITQADALEAQQHAGIKAWVKDQLQGEVTDITRLERWRPQWKVSYTAGGEQKAVLFRGNRPIADPDNLKFEMQVMETLEANGIKVPHIYGWVDSPKAFVMEWIDTEDRAPGMLHTAIENPSTMSDERWQAMLNYMSDLAAVHEVPVEKFAHIKQLATPPQTPEEIALGATERMYQNGSMAGNIDPEQEFLQRWLRRNVPMHRNEARFIAGDAGQFMSSGTDVLALLDFEIADIGDIHWDLACFRGRHPYENMGDIPALYRHYEQVTGTALDWRAIGYHTVAFLQMAGVAAKFFMLPEAQGGNWIEGVLEYTSITRRAFEAIAELQGIELDYDLELPTPVIKRWEDIGFRKMLVDIDNLPTSSAFEPWERELLHAIPAFLMNYARYRDWFERETIQDIAALTGQGFDNIEQADAAITALIAEENTALDTQLVQLGHRRTLRLSMIIAGTNPDDKNPLFHRLDPIFD